MNRTEVGNFSTEFKFKQTSAKFKFFFTELLSIIGEKYMSILKRLQLDYKLSQRLAHSLKMILNYGSFQWCPFKTTIFFSRFERTR